MPVPWVLSSHGVKRAVVLLLTISLQLKVKHPATLKAAETATTDTSKDVDYFNNHRTHPESSSYDQIFHYQAGYNPKLKREDMQHTQVHDHASK